MRTLGIDAGERRIGIAISDPEGRLAVLLKIINRRGGNDARTIADLSRAEGVERIVVGLPVSMSGEEGPQAERARTFASALELAAAVPVLLYDERLTTVEADRRMSAAGMNSRAMKANRDAVAASIILQSFLDSQRFPALPPIEYD